MLMRYGALPSLALALCVWSVASCKGPGSVKPEAKEATVSSASALADAKVKRFGDAIAKQNDVEFSRVLDDPTAYEKKTVTLEGHVRRVCKRMGCWMELAEGTKEGARSCRVFFGAHQFFVPTDSEGQQARVQGSVEVRRVEAKFVNHLEEEGASFESKSKDGSAEEVRLVASGVELISG